MNGPLLVLPIFIHKHGIQNNLAKIKPRIEMGKIEPNGPGIPAPLTASPPSFLEGVAAAIAAASYSKIQNIYKTDKIFVIQISHHFAKIFCRRN